MEFLENFEQANTSKLLFVVLAIVCEASPVGKFVIETVERHFWYVKGVFDSSNNV